MKDYSENLYNVIRHLEFTKQLPGATYIYISSGGTVYGNFNKRLPITEDHPNAPLSPYGITKLACEKYVLMYKEIYGMDVKIVRPSNVMDQAKGLTEGRVLLPLLLQKFYNTNHFRFMGQGCR